MKILLLTILLLSSVAMQAQDDRHNVTVNLTRASVRTMFEQIRQQTGFSFVYNSDEIKSIPAISVKATNEPVEKVLEKALKGTGFTYRIRKNIITIKREYRQSTPESAANRRVDYRRISGKVTDSDGEPLPGVSIIMKENNTVGCATDADGKYWLGVPDEKDLVLVYSFVGMVNKEVKIGGKTEINVVMKDDVAMLKSVEVVGNGMFQRRTETFTGSAITYSGDQLRVNGSVNAIQSLKNLDPSFVINESVDFGSNPNVMPDVQIRGKSSIDLRGDYETSPNLPLFILNGFETTLEKIVDMDMNLIASVTILKDAAAKAIYGSKAANGVVVVETVQPKAGKLRVSYNASLDLTVPDLNSYDLCDAKEKLQAEVLAGKYTDNTNAQSQARLTEQYNAIYKEVARGVDTYWMAQPLRTGIGQKHSVMLDGGEGSMLYSASLSYNDVQGVMKGSDRRTVSGNVTLSYRVKKLIFRNQLTIDDNTADNSPYGDFSLYSRMNPYWRIHDTNGKLIKQYDNGTYNPLSDAVLNSKNQSKYTLITENFYTEWNILKNLKFTGRVGFVKRKESSDVFIPASNSQYASILPSSEEYLKRGSYTQGHGHSSALNLDLGLGYNLSSGKHNLFTNVQYSIEEQIGEQETFTAIGFPSDRMDFISFGNGYAEGSKPTGSENTTRSVGVIGALNYSYDDRYLADLSWRFNASSQFGSKNKWGNFWSAGAGWNLHHEEWLKNNRIINYLKIRASIGRTGSQNFSSYQALSTYSYITDKTYNGDMGVTLMALANPGLKWQRQLDRSIGVDFTLFNRLSARMEYYDDLTDNLLMDVTLAPSSGFSTYKENLGETDNKGFEVALSYNLLSIPSHRTSVNLFWNMSHNENRISKLSNALKNYNKQQDEAYDDYAGAGSDKAEQQRKVSTRYEEGQSMTAIWAVRSAGIDPVTGREVFIKKNGTTTFDWSSEDLVVCGDSQSKFQGSFGLNAHWNNWDMNLSFSYKTGGQTYNSTLVDKVENVDVKNWNVDRRVLTERWNAPGQVAKFKSILDTSITKPTSRFVEDYNELAFSVISIGYDFSSLPFVKHSPLEYLKLTATMNDIGWLSSVKKEWGLSYPRARQFSFTLSARF